MKPANFPRNKERRQREAKERQAAYNALSLQEKIDRAKRHMVLGNSKELARLTK